MVKWVWIGVGAVVVLVAGGMVILMLRLPAIIEQRLVAATRQQAGLELTFAGPLKVHTGGALRVVARGLALEQPSGNNAPLLKVRELSADLTWANVLHGQYLPQNISLIGPVLSLDVDKEGRRNWPKTIALPLGAPPPPGKPRRATRLAINGGRIIYSEDGRNIHQETGITEAVITRTASGKLDLRAALSVGKRKTPLRVAGQFAIAGKRVAFEGVRSKLANTSATWTGSFDLSGDRPVLNLEGETALIDVEEIAGLFGEIAAASEPIPRAVEEAPSDMRITALYDGLVPVLAGADAGERASSSPAQAPAEPAAPAGRAPASSGLASALGAIAGLDIRASLFCQQLRRAGAKIDATVFSLDAKEGLVSLDALQSGAEQRTASATLEIDTTRAVPRYNARVQLADAASGPLSMILTGRRLVTGKASLDLTASGSGLAIDDALRSLGGTSRFTLRDGALHGVDIRKTILSLGAGGGYDPAKRTRFKRLTGAYRIKAGVARSSETARLAGPEVTISSTGRVDIARERVRQRLRIRLRPPPFTLAIPVLLEGAWRRPAIKWDWSAVMRTPNHYAIPRDVLTNAVRPDEATRRAIRSFIESGAGGAGMAPEKQRILRLLVE